MKKIFSILMLIVLLAITPVLAANTDKYEIYQVAVDGSTITSTGSAVNLERGENIKVEIWFNGKDNVHDVVAEAEIKGYEYGSIREVTDEFKVLKDSKDKVTIYLDVPQDIDGSKAYTLYTSLSDDKEEYRLSFPVNILEKKHLLNLQDVLVNTNSVKAGSYLNFKVRVENLGYEKEQDIAVQASIPELGVYYRNYIDELVAYEEEGSDEETSASSNSLLLAIPKDAKTGDYELNIKVIYNRGHTVLEQTKMIHVEGIETVSKDNTIISVDSDTKNFKKGEEGSYKLMIANLNGKQHVYSAEIIGEKLWAESRIDPSFITVQPDSTGSMYIYLIPSKDSTVVPGRHLFTVKVKSGDNVVGELNLIANVEETKAGFVDLSGAKNILLFGFGALAVILVILGLVIAFNKMRTRETTEEGKTYY